MKIGISSYSLARAISGGIFDLCGAIRYVAEIGGQHIELVPGDTFSFADENDPMIGKVRKQASDCGIDLSSYTIGANFICGGGHDYSKEETAAEIERVKGQIRIGAALGVRFMRHDAGSRPIPQCSVAQFEKDLPVVADACRELADYAKQFGITTSVENHGYHFQGSERVHRLVNLVGRDNFRTTMDIGNFTCADEDPVIAVRNNISIASFIHFKDFLMRKKIAAPDGFFGTLHGRFLRATITGHGDVDLVSIAGIIRESGYDGYVSIEFEGMEECREAVRISLANVKALFA